jgi:hypothetical protein
MEFLEVQIAYIWGTFLSRTGYITGVHYFPSEIEDFFEKPEEIKPLL